jgi:5-methyltetrahydropteroyltriglutamate--homocysteine methyltransferase
VPDTTTVVLGTDFVPIERLGISPQCGFASTAPGNLMEGDDQRRTLELVVSVAEEVWGS